MRWIALPLVLVFAMATTSCGPTEEEMAAAAAAAAEAQADSLMTAATAGFDAAVYDTLTWENDEARMARGLQVYSFSCQRCHGASGIGDGGFVMGGDTLTPPSFREPTWAMAGEIAAVRRAIFIGTKEGMPHWGLEGLKAESVDAVAHYVLEGFGGN